MFKLLEQLFLLELIHIRATEFTKNYKKLKTLIFL